MKKDATEGKSREARATQIDDLENVPGDLLISGSRGWTLLPQNRTDSASQDQRSLQPKMMTILA
tara:strand:+ start:3800 stop:3991 length:192 start_codon:yes stop_codon:yes gene_type:complete